MLICLPPSSHKISFYIVALNHQPGSHDKTVKVWNAKDGTLAYSLNSHAHWVNHLALSTDFVIRTAFHDHTGKIPDSDFGKVARAKERFLKAATIQGEVVERLVSASDVRPNFYTKSLNMTTSSSEAPTLVFSIYKTNWVKDFTMYLWEPSKGTKPIARLHGHQKQVNHVTFSPDGLLIASAGFGRTQFHTRFLFSYIWSYQLW